MAARIGDVSLDDLLNNNTDLQQNTPTYTPDTTQETSGILPATKRSIGGGFSSLGRFAQEVGLPSEGLKSYGQEIQKEAGVSPVQNLSDFANHPGAAVSEGLGAGVGSMLPTVAASVAGNVVGGVVGGSLGSVVPGAGTVAGAEIGRRLGGGLARAAVNIPTYIGSNLERQDETGQHDFGKAVAGALGQAAAEEVEAQAIGGLLPGGLSKKLGIDSVAKLTGAEGFSGGTMTRLMKGALTAGASNAAEEYMQQQIERAQAGLDIGSDEAIQEGAFNAALGAIAGAGLGGAAGVANKKPVTNIPGSNSEFSNGDIEKNYKRLDDLLAQRVDAEKSGQDTAGFDANIDEILSHLDSKYVNPVSEDGKKADVKPVDKQEAESVLGFVNKLKEAQKPAQEEIELKDLTPMQAMSEGQLAIAADNAKSRLKELNSKASGKKAPKYVNPETGKEVKLPASMASYLSETEKQERKMLNNILKSGNREALVNWHESIYKPTRVSPVSAEGIDVKELTSDQLATQEEINIPDVSGERFADQMSATPETIDYSNVPSPVVPEEITAKGINPVRETIINKENKLAQQPVASEEINLQPYEESEDVRIAQTKAFKAKAPATRLLNKLGVKDTHEVAEVAPKQFQIVRKNAPVAEQVPASPVAEVAPSTEPTGDRFFQQQAGFGRVEDTGETAGLFSNQAFDISPEETVFHASDKEFDALDASKSKDFGIHFGSKETVDNISQKSGKGNIYSAKLDTTDFVELPDLDSWNVKDVTTELVKTEWFKSLPKTKQTYLVNKFGDIVTRYNSEARSYGVNLVALSSKYNKELSKLLSSPTVGLNGIKYKNFKEGTGEYSYLVINPEIIQDFGRTGAVLDSGIEVSEITDPDMVKAIMAKAFTGEKQTIDLSKFVNQKPGMIKGMMTKIETAVNKVADSVKDTGIRIEFAETTANIPDAKIRDMAQKETKSGMRVRGMLDDRSNVIYIIGNGSRSPQEAVGTLYHELVGHYGMRKILGHKFENYMERLLKSPKLTQKIYNLGGRWKSYLTDNPATKYDNFTWPGIKDENGKPIVTSRTAAIKLADEYVAELAKLFTSPNTVDRYNLRTKENKNFLDKVISFIKHLYRSMGFGSAIDSISNEEIMQDLAKSYNSLFVKDDMSADGIAKLNSNPKDVYTDEEIEDSFTGQFDVTETTDSLFGLEEEGFGKTNFDEKQAGWNKFSAWLAHKPIAKNFVHLGTLQYQNQLLRLYNKARGKTTEIEKITRDIHEKFGNLNKVQKIKMYEMLTEQNYDRSRLTGIVPADVVDLAQQAKDKISEYGDMLVKLGKLDPITYEENKDKYLRTRYAKYLGESKGVGKIGSYQNYLKKKKDLTETDKVGLLEIKDPEFLLVDTLGTVGRDTALLGLLHNINFLSEKEKLGWAITDPTLFSVDGTEMTLEEAKEHLERQRSIVKDQGELIGYDSPEVVRLSQQADQLESQITAAYAKLDQKIAEFSQQQGMPSSMSPKEFKDTYYTRLPKGKQYGKLSGMYVRKEIYDDLREGIDAFYNTNTQGKILKTMETGHRLWKTAKVSWNLPTWFQNAFGNFGLLDLASPTNVGSLAQMTAQEIHGAMTGKESKYWTLGQDNGVFGTTLASQELYTNEAGFALKIKKLADQNSGHKFADAWDQLKNLFLTVNDKTSNWYGLLEGTFKVVAIRDHIQRWEKESGMKLDDLTGNEREAVIGSAVRFANDAIFDYSAVPNWVKQIRRFPLGSPFLTFSYKALPAIMKALRYNPKKFIKYAIMPTLMMQMFLMANPDMDEEDYEEIIAKQPQYMKDKSSMFLLPWKNVEGKWEFWDAGYLLPWSPFINWGLYVKNHFDAMNYETTAESTIDAGYELLANTFGVLGGPAPQLISVWKTGVDPFTKEPIFEEGQPASAKWWKGTTYFANMMMPSWLSGQGFAGKLQDSLGVDIGPIKAEPLNRYGSLKTTPGEAVAGLAGMKVKGVDPQESHLSNLKMFEVKEQQIKKAKSSELKNKNLDPAERLEIIKKYNALLINERRKRSEYIRSVNPQS